MSASTPTLRRSSGRRTIFADRAATVVMWAIGAFVLLVLGGIIVHFVLETIGFMSVGFLVHDPTMTDYGIGPYLWDSLYILVLTMLFSTPIGILGGIYMAEYAPDNRVTGTIRFAQEAVSSVPSIVVGLFGYILLAQSLHMGFSLLVGALALTVFNLPLMTRLTEQAIRAVPQEERNASLALGATKWQTIRNVVLPLAIPGIATGVILTAGRAFGEAAVLLFTTGQNSPTNYNFGNVSLTNPASPWSPFRIGGSLAVFIWVLRTNGQLPHVTELANGASMVLIAVVLLFNLGARLLSRVLTRRFTAA